MEDSETGAVLESVAQGHPLSVRSHSLSPKPTVSFSLKSDLKAQFLEPVLAVPSPVKETTEEEESIPKPAPNPTPKLSVANAATGDSMDAHHSKMQSFASKPTQFVENKVPPPESEAAATLPDVDSSTQPYQPQSPLAISVSSKMDSDTHTVSQIPTSYISTPAKISFDDTLASSGDDTVSEINDDSAGGPSSPPLLNSTGKSARAPKLSTGSSFLTINTTLASSLPQSSACFSSPHPYHPNPDSIPQSAAHDLSSMFNPLLGEYTSITDFIDTSCFGEHSPPCSPIPKNFYDPDGQQEKKSEKPAALSKQQLLKQAEEAEHQRMEGLIRHRLRQISQVSYDRLYDGCLLLDYCFCY